MALTVLASIKHFFQIHIILVGVIGMVARHDTVIGFLILPVKHFPQIYMIYAWFIGMDVDLDPLPYIHGEIAINPVRPVCRLNLTRLRVFANAFEIAVAFGVRPHIYTCPHVGYFRVYDFAVFDKPCGEFVFCRIQNNAANSYGEENDAHHGAENEDWFGESLDEIDNREKQTDGREKQTAGYEY
jgi:hypothetical protein